MKKWLVSTMLCSVMAVSLMAGCGSKDAVKDTTKAAAENAAETKAAAGEKGKIVFGGKGFTEAYLLSEIYSDALEDNGYEVERIYDMNTDTITPAIQNGEIDMYPEYVGTALTDVLGMDMEGDVQKAYENVSKGYMDNWNIQWLDLTSMEDKVVMVMTKEKADSLGVKTLTDLQKVADQLVLGDGVNFAEREDDLLRLNKIFGEFKFTVVNVDYSLAYNCLDDGSADVIPGLSTDVQLLDDKYVVIEEDKPVWPPQYVAPIIRKEVLDANPEVAEICNEVSKHISTEDMIKMLDRVFNGKEEYEDVALDFYENNCK